MNKRRQQFGGYARQVERAAALHAEAHKSDPFAYARMKRTLLSGHDQVAKVIEDANRILTTNRERVEADFKAWIKKLGMTPGQAWAQQRSQVAA